MTFLELVRRLAREARITGQATVPATVVGQIGELLNCVEWIQEAHADLQRDFGGRWSFLRKAFSFETSNTVDEYAYGVVTDVEAGTAIARFQAWRVDDYILPPQIYRTADGVAAQRDVIVVPYAWFMRLYGRGPQQLNTGTPVHMTVTPRNTLLLGPTPNGAYTVTGEFYRSAQEMTADAHEPEFPSDYHMYLVYAAMVDHGYTNVAAEVLQRGALRKSELRSQLKATQREPIRLRGPMA